MRPLDVAATRTPGSARRPLRCPSSHSGRRFRQGHWERWCAQRGIDPLPADPTSVCTYLTERVEAGIAVTSLNVTADAIGHVHRTHGLANPIAHHSARQIRADLRRIHGVAPPSGPPLTVPEFLQIVGASDRSTVVGVRDAAIILPGYASALRSYQVVARTVADLGS